MPLPRPLTPEQWNLVAALLGDGLGRNETARRACVAPASVSKVARFHGFSFARADQTAAATQCARIDAAQRRLERERGLLEQQMAALSGGQVRRAIRIEKRISDLDRFHLRI